MKVHVDPILSIFFPILFLDGSSTSLVPCGLLSLIIATCFFVLIGLLYKNKTRRCSKQQSGNQSLR